MQTAAMLLFSFIHSFTFESPTKPVDRMKAVVIVGKKPTNNINNANKSKNRKGQNNCLQTKPSWEIYTN